MGDGLRSLLVILKSRSKNSKCRILENFARLEDTKKVPGMMEKDESGTGNQARSRKQKQALRYCRAEGGGRRPHLSLMGHTGSIFQGKTDTCYATLGS